MDWRDALFLHWPVSADLLDARLPSGITPRTHDGSAWLGIVAFVLTDIRPRGLPRALGLTFGEANLRTYVTGPDGGDGIYFYNLDADDLLGVPVARLAYQLPYYKADMAIRRTGSGPDGAVTGGSVRSVEFVSHRTHPGVESAYIDVSYGPQGEPFHADGGSLEAFLVENYRFYIASSDVSGLRADEDAGGGRTDERLFYGDVAHPPWELYEADVELRSTNFFAVNGFECPNEEPLAHYSPGVRVDADRIRRLD